MENTITKLPHQLVPPAEPTPSGKLSLSWLDKHPANRRTISVLSVYARGGQKAADVIRRALAAALVQYYPLAGRIVESEDEELVVDCTAEGVLFVEATAKCSLRDVGNLDYPLMVPEELLLPDSLDSFDISISMQVTSFACGGFAVGLIFNHILMDGIGAGQFLRAIAGAAKGNIDSVPEPIWCRDSLPNFLNLQPGVINNQLDEQLHQSFKPELHVLDISIENVNKLLRNVNFSCSTFDVLTARLWQCRTMAVKEDIGAEVHLLFALDIRPYVDKQTKFPYKPENYYGNLNYAFKVTAPTETILHAPLAEIVEYIDRAKKKMSLFTENEDMLKLLSYYGSMVVRDWKTVGISDIDYGCGGPVLNNPLRIGGDIALCYHVSSPKLENGERVITYCVKQEHLERFRREMMSF